MKRSLLLVSSLSVFFMLSASAWATPVLDTGQTKCYDNTQEIICPQPGEDFYGQDANYAPCNPHSYTDLGNGIVRDNVTGLEWQQDSALGTYKWQQAMDYCNNLVLGGYSDWRLPTSKELATLVDSNIPHPGPTIDADYFPNTVGDYYWSSNTYVGGESFAWYVRFTDGHMYVQSKNENDYVRAVRGEQYGPSGNYIDNGDGTITDTDTGLMWQKDIGGNRSWYYALSYCENLTLGGYNDWRLPNRNELLSIVDHTRLQPAINPVFNAYSVEYWSSSTYAYTPTFGWIVNFAQGSVLAWSSPKLSGYQVRAVRGGQCDLDSDGISDNEDNCPNDYNPLQEDNDGDGIGDICDPDDDNDDIPDDGDNSGTPGDNPCTGGQTINCDDNCSTDPNPLQEDSDSDGMGNVCDPDDDNDGICDPGETDTSCTGSDDCPFDADNDVDEDSICGDIDNCPNDYNPNQEDSYPPQHNNCGDTCECEGNFDDDEDVDGSDAATFKADFGRSSLQKPCTNADRCNGDFKCDVDVDGSDASLFKSDFGRSAFNNPCPNCITEPWCAYP